MIRWIVAACVVVVIGLGIVGAARSDGDWGPNHESVVTRSVASDGTETIIIHDGDRHFFPFGLFIFPLVIFGSLFFLRALAFRGRWGGNGPWTPGGPRAGEIPSRFEEWHRRAHASDTPPPDQTPAA